MVFGEVLKKYWNGNFYEFYEMSHALQGYFVINFYGNQTGEGESAFRKHLSFPLFVSRNSNELKGLTKAMCILILVSFAC